MDKFNLGFKPTGGFKLKSGRIPIHWNSFWEDPFQNQVPELASGFRNWHQVTELLLIPQKKRPMTRQ
jgi:hypothetical protein